MRALIKEGQCCFLQVETLWSTKLRHLCFASASPSNTVLQGASGGPCCLPATTLHPHYGLGPHEQCLFHIASFYPACTERTRKTLQHPSGALGGHCLSPAMCTMVCCQGWNICHQQEGSVCAHPVPDCTSAPQVLRSRGAALLPW